MFTNLTPSSFLAPLLAVSISGFIITHKGTPAPIRLTALAWLGAELYEFTRTI